MPKQVEPWTSTTLRETLAKIGAKAVSHGQYLTFQLAEWVSEHGRLTKIGLSDWN